MNKLDLHEMQLRFECLGCGKCCSHGGDMLVTADEVAVMCAYVYFGSYEPFRDLFEPVPFKPGYFKVTHKFPCRFYDSELNKCRVYEVRPAACRRYPFESFACGETTLAGVTICEGASRLVCAEFCTGKDP